MKKKKKNKKNLPIKDIYIDADFLVYETTEGKANKTGGFTKRVGSTAISTKPVKKDLQPFKDKFLKKVSDIENHVALLTISEPFTLGDTHLVFTPKRNFRHDIYPAYKANRVGKGKSPEFARIKKWVMKSNLWFEGFEADDVVSLMAREGHLVVSFDKDVYKSTEGIFYNPHNIHKCIIKTSKLEAERFTLIQTLTGDSTDNILALPKVKGHAMIDGIPLGNGKRKPFKVTETLAIALLDEFGWNWKGVVKAFKSKGFGKKEALLNRRLIGMHQMHRKKDGGFKLKLFKPN